MADIWNTPGFWTETANGAYGGLSPPSWWDALDTQARWEWYRNADGFSYPTTIIYTGTDAIPTGDVTFNYYVREQPNSEPVLLVYRFNAAANWSSVQVADVDAAPGTTGTVKFTIPDGTTHLEWGLAQLQQYGTGGQYWAFYGAQVDMWVDSPTPPPPPTYGPVNKLTFQANRDRINETSSHVIEVWFMNLPSLLDTAGEAVSPDNAWWRLDNPDSQWAAPWPGTPLVPWTEIDLSDSPTSVQLQIPPSASRCYSARPIERRQLTVVVDRGLDTEYAETFTYEVGNNRVLRPWHDFP